ncbi:MAG: DUF1592 domain-containing protein [Rhodospirillaceae bacterium]
MRKRLLLSVAASLLLGSCADNSPKTDVQTAAAVPPAEVVTRRLSPEQYEAIISDVFGSHIKIGGRFDPGLRVDGLLELGTSQVSVSEASMQQYDNMARTVAAQVVAPDQRRLTISCAPAAATAPDDACARSFLGEVGRLLFRRPLTPAEEDLYVRAARTATERAGDFYFGLGIGLAAQLESPQFLFRHEVTKATGRPGEYTLDGYSRASRLSFFLWNSGPDLSLLEAAEKGELDTPEGLARQVDRMIASRRIENGTRAFFSDMLHFDDIANLSKDTAIYPMFTNQVAGNARDQTLKTIVDLLITNRGDYRDLFTTRKTFLTQTLASLYRVPLAVEMPNGYPDEWHPYEFSAGDPRSGILSHVSFVALHSHPGRSSPTLRGKALREIMLCQKVPPPPGEVNFTVVQDTANPRYRTARDRLAAHAENPVCAGCHRITDPMGLALENFDGSGGYRTNENGVALDTTGALDGVKFTNAAELGAAVAQNPALISCVVDRLSSYAMGRAMRKADAPWTGDLRRQFAEAGYKFPALMRAIALSPDFYRAAPPAGSQTAQLTSLSPEARK